MLREVMNELKRIGRTGAVLLLVSAALWQVAFIQIDPFPIYIWTAIGLVGLALCAAYNRLRDVAGLQLFGIVEIAIAVDGIMAAASSAKGLFEGVVTGLVVQI